MSWITGLFGKKTPLTKPAEKSGSGAVETLCAVVLSDLGNIRTNNEDMGLFFNVADENVLREKGYLLLVADGMGGHQAGEVASKMAADIISREYFKSGSDLSPEKSLARAFQLANRRILEKASAQSSMKGMGTTCTALVVLGSNLYYAQVGDSRAYIKKAEAIIQITQDQTYVQDLLKAGSITPEEAAEHPKRNILTNAMGTKADMPVDAGLSILRFEENDKLLLCSDGLYEYIKDDELNEILKANDLQSIADTLIKKAKARGGHDNITVVLAQKKDTGETETKITRDVEILKMTRDADLPENLNTD